MLQACLNGGRGTPAPSDIETCAAEASAAVAAGAEELHIHPRDAEGRESLRAVDVAAWLDAARATVPGVPVGISTSAAMAPHGPDRLKAIASWTTLPDYVSINLGEHDAPEVMALMRDRGIGIEAGIWTTAEADRFLALPDASVLRILVELPNIPGDAARPAAEAILAKVGHAAPVLLHGLDRSAWPLIRMAAQRGLDTRIGLEDTTTLPNGAAAPGNAALVSAAREIMGAA